MEELFLELLNKYEMAEEDAINYAGTLEDYTLLNEEIEEYKERFYKLLKNS